MLYTFPFPFIDMPAKAKLPLKQISFTADSAFRKNLFLLRSQLEGIDWPEDNRLYCKAISNKDAISYAVREISKHLAAGSETEEEKVEAVEPAY